MAEAGVESCCPSCGAYTRSERVFCLGCRRRPVPITPLDIEVEDFVYQPGLDNLELLQSTGPTHLPRKAATREGATKRS